MDDNKPLIKSHKERMKMAIKKAKVSINNEILTWEFADGHKVEVDATQLSEEVQALATLHGLKQKLSDTYAGCKTPTEARMAMEASLKGLLAGQWNAGRSSSGGVFVEALAIVAKVSIDEALEKWNEMDDEAKKAIKAHPQIKLEKAKIEMERARRAAEGVDFGGLISFEE